MAKTRTAQVSQSKMHALKSWVRRHPLKSLLWLALLVLVIWVGVAEVVHQKRVNDERAEFTQAQADLDQIYDQIVAKVGQPTAHKATQTCSYTSAEFSKGFLYCNFQEFSFYPDTALLSLRTNTINAIILSAPGASNMEPGVTISSSKANNIETENFILASRFSCFVDYWQVDRELPYNLHDFSNNNQSGLFFEIGCKKRALSNYYPLSTT